MVIKCHNSDTMPENNLVRLYEHHLNLLSNVVKHKKQLGLCTKKSMDDYNAYVEWLNLYHKKLNSQK